MEGKIVVVESDFKGRELVLSEGTALIGADSDCSLCVPAEGVREKHVQVLRRRGTWFARTLDPSSLIESQGRLVPELRLDHGTVFTLGAADFRFVTPRAVIESTPAPAAATLSAEQAMEQLGRARDQIFGEVGKIVVGQTSVIREVLVALFSRGHCLLVGVPGLAKTLLVKTLAGTLDLDARRIQFTPDLMPSDVTGTDILEEDTGTRRRRFRFNRGPVFTNMLLADEINRTPPKTQAALLQAMQELCVTTAGITYDLPQPFLVLATQNPIELEGTYPLPEAQLDRFMFSVRVDYPDHDEETRILQSTTRDRIMEVERVLDAEQILGLQHLVRQVPVSDHVAAYAAALCRATRPDGDSAPDFVNDWVRWGAGPRAGQFLLLAAKAHALLNASFNVSCTDIREYALPVFRHRIFRNFAATSEGVSTDEIVRRVIEQVPEPEYS